MIVELKDKLHEKFSMQELDNAPHILEVQIEREISQTMALPTRVCAEGVTNLQYVEFEIEKGTAADVDSIDE